MDFFFFFPLLTQQASKQRERFEIYSDFFEYNFYLSLLVGYPIPVWNTKNSKDRRRQSHELNIFRAQGLFSSLHLKRGGGGDRQTGTQTQTHTHTYINAHTHTRRHTHTHTQSHIHTQARTDGHESSIYIDILPEVSFVSQNMCQLLVPGLVPLPQHISGLVQHGTRHVLLSGVVADGGLHHPLHLLRGRFSWRQADRCTHDQLRWPTGEGWPPLVRLLSSYYYTTHTDTNPNTYVRLLSSYHYTTHTTQTLTLMQPDQRLAGDKPKRKKNAINQHVFPSTKPRYQEIVNCTLFIKLP